MAKGALVGINVSDTDELRINKINANFRLVFDKAISKPTVTQETVVDQGVSQREIDDAVDGMKNDISWLTKNMKFDEAVKEIVVTKPQDIVDWYYEGVDSSMVTVYERNGSVVVNIKNFTTTSTTRNLLCTIKEGYWPTNELTGAGVMLGDTQAVACIIKVTTDGTVLMNAYNNPTGMQAFANMSYLVLPQATSSPQPDPGK